MGKGWAKGLTAATDARIAHNAARHRGLTYISRISVDEDQRRKSAPAKLQWTPTLAYAVGLIATDGGLVRGRTISFPSADRELVEILLRCLDKSNRISIAKTKAGGIVYRTQIGDVGLHRWLVGIGVSPRKSLTIGAVDVPSEFFLDFVRGLLDGDGSIMNKRARADTKRSKDYYWEYLRTKFVSASRDHVVWLRERLIEVADVDGYIEPPTIRLGRSACYTLRYGKVMSLRLLPRLYADPDAPRLTRKWRIWDDYVTRHSAGPDRDQRLGKMSAQAQVAKPADAHV